MVQVGLFFGFHINKKLIRPGTAVNRAAFDLEQVHAVFGKGFERSEQRTGTMSESHGKGSFAGFAGEPRSRFFFRHEKNKTREVLGIVLNAFGENHAMIMLSGAARGNGGARLVSGGNSFADAPGGVLGGHTLPFGMGRKKALALRQRHWMRGHRPDSIEPSSGQRSEPHH